jgi:hypothetical protein
VIRTHDPLRFGARNLRSAEQRDGQKWLTQRGTTRMSRASGQGQQLDLVTDQSVVVLVSVRHCRLPQLSTS